MSKKYFIVLIIFLTVFGILSLGIFEVYRVKYASSKEIAQLKKIIQVQKKENQKLQPLLPIPTLKNQSELNPEINPTMNAYIDTYLKDKNLRDMQCTELYQDSFYGPSSKYFYLNPARPDVQIDSVLLPSTKAELVNRLPLSDQNTLQAIQFCKAIYNNSILTLTGRSTQDIKIGEFDAPKLVGNSFVYSYKQITSNNITPPKANFFSCSLIAFDSSQNVYYVCISADGIVTAEPGAWEAEYLYVTNFDSGKNTLLYSCEAEVSRDRQIIANCNATQ